MRRRRIDFPLALALGVSLLLHMMALLGPQRFLTLMAFEINADIAPAPARLDAVLRPPPVPARAPARVVPPPAPLPTPVSKLRRRPPAPALPVADVAPRPALPQTTPAVVPALPVDSAVTATAAADTALRRTEAVPPEPTFVPAAPAPTVPPAIDLPRKGRIRYVITRGEGGLVIGQNVHSWSHDGRLYTARSVTETTGLAALFKPVRVVQESRGELDAQGLRPGEFRHERASGAQDVDRASLDWPRGVVAYAGREEALPAGTQDMLSMYYQIALLAAQGRLAATLELPIATGRKLERYRFERLGEETLSQGGREHLTRRLRTRNGNDTIEIWVAVTNVSLPLKIRIIDRKGEIYDQIADLPSEPGTERP